MLDLQSLCKQFRVRPGKRFRLKDFDPAWSGGEEASKAKRKSFAEELLSKDVTNLAAAQEKLYAADSYSLLVIFQAMDAAGKDSTIKHVMSGINPQGVQVYSFKQPSSEELDHDFLWRCAKCVPERGRIGIFNRSYYEEVLVVKVHPEYLAAQRLPNAAPHQEKFWQERYNSINHFERHLTHNGTAIIKFFLYVSKDKQRERFLERMNDPAKHWKFSLGDLAERELWNEYMAAYEQCLAETSTDEAPWYVIPADHKWVSRALVAQIITQTVDDLDLQWPEPTPQQVEAIAAARQQLAKEEG